MVGDLSKIEVGKKALITTDSWFFAPDGDQYRAIFGTVHGIETDDQLLGVKTNERSTNWYVIIGNMTIAGCQIHYAIRTDNVFKHAPTVEIKHEDKLVEVKSNKKTIYIAD